MVKKPAIFSIKWVIFLLILGLAVFPPLVSSNESKGGQKMTLNEMKNLSKSEIIKIAVDRIKYFHTDFEEKNYDIKRVLAGKDVIKVRFNLSYVYVPKNSFLYHDIEVSFFNEGSPSVNIGSLKNPEELDIPKLEAKFFKPNQESNKAIEFAKKVFQRENMKVTDPVTILNKGKYFSKYFEVTTEEEPGKGGVGIQGGFKISKWSKKIYDRWHKEFFFNPQYRELNEIN